MKAPSRSPVSFSWHLRQEVRARIAPTNLSRHRWESYHYAPCKDTFPFRRSVSRGVRRTSKLTRWRSKRLWHNFIDVHRRRAVGGDVAEGLRASRSAGMPKPERKIGKRDSAADSMHHRFSPVVTFMSPMERARPSSTGPTRVSSNWSARTNSAARDSPPWPSAEVRYFCGPQPEQRTADRRCFIA